MDVRRITQILDECAGEVGRNGDALPGTQLVDVWEIIPLNTAKVREHEQEMIRILQDWPMEHQGHYMPPLGGEVSYLITGLILGDKALAFRLFAYGKLLNWWAVIDPRGMLNVTRDDETAKDLVEIGWVSILGYAPIPAYVD